MRHEGGEGDGLQDHQVQELHQNEQEDQDKGKNYRFDIILHFMHCLLCDQNKFQRTKPAKCLLLQLLIIF